MNFSNILNEISKADPEVFERTSQRRDVIRNWTKRIALTALPFAVGSLFQKAYGKTTDLITDTLNFALTLEYLEAEFYASAISSAGLIPAGAATGAIQTIANHEAAHVNFLKAAITSAGGVPVAKPTFDFTAGNGSNNGPFAGVFTNYALFLAVAQVFEDTGVRAYKGQAGNLMENNDVLTAALNIHSVEARHASHIRQMRKANGGLVAGTIKPWVTGNESNIVSNPGSAAIQLSYNGEELTTQAGAVITGIGGSGVSAGAASESFDEPLDKAQVLAIVDPFIVP
jgi:hypothetical protein